MSNNIKDNIEKILGAWIVGATKELFGTSVYFLPQKSKIDPPPEYATVRIMNTLPIGRIQRESIPDSTKVKLKSPKRIIASINIFGDNAFGKAISLGNSLEGHRWNHFLSLYGLAYETRVEREVTSAGSVEFIEQAQMDVWFNTFWITEEERGHIEHIEGTGLVYEKNKPVEEDGLEVNLQIDEEDEE